MKPAINVHVKREGKFWVIRELGYPDSVGIKADALVMSCSRQGHGYVNGRIMAIHGLEQEVHTCLNAAQSAALGVGAQVSGTVRKPTVGRYSMVYLSMDGKITEV